MGKVLPWIALTIGILSGIGSLWKDWKHASEPNYKKANQLGLFLFVMLCGSIVLSTTTSILAINKQESSDIETHIKDSLNKKLSDSLLEIQTDLKQYQFDLNKLALSQLDTLRSVAYLSQKLIDAQSQVLETQNILHNEVAGDKGYCVFYFKNFHERSVSGVERGLALKIYNPNKFPLFNLHIDVYAYDKFQKSLFFYIGSGSLNNDDLYLQKDNLKHFEIEEISSQQELNIAFIKSYKELYKEDHKYKLFIVCRARSNYYLEELIHDEDKNLEYARLLKPNKDTFTQVKEVRLEALRSSLHSDNFVREDIPREKINWYQEFKIPDYREFKLRKKAIEDRNLILEQNRYADSLGQF